MGRKSDLTEELESARQEFLQLVGSIPGDTYERPSANPAWTIGDVLYHIALGPSAMHAETWMILHVPWLFSAFFNNRTAGLLNRVNALVARRPKRITPEILARSYERGHDRLVNSLQKMRDQDLNRSFQYPESMGTELAGVVTVERLFRYVKLHLKVHADQVRSGLG